MGQTLSPEYVFVCRLLQLVSHCLPLYRPIKPFVKHPKIWNPTLVDCENKHCAPTCLRYRKTMADPSAVGTRPLLRFLEPWENASTSDFALEQAKLKWGGSFGLEYMRAIDALRR